MRRLEKTIAIRGEWLGLAGVLLAASGIYALLIHPSLASFAALDGARSARERAVRELLAVRQEHQDLLAKIANRKRQLESLGGSPPSLRDKENQIAHITSIAQACRLSIDQYSPIGDVDTADYSAVYVQFAARGPFAEIYEFFRRMESELDYVDMTHFTLTSTLNENLAEPACVVTWSCKLSGMPRSQSSPEKEPGPFTVPPAEVALHEP